MVMGKKAKGGGRPRGAISKDKVVPAKTLAKLLKPTYERFAKEGIDDEHMPTNESLISTLLKCLDPAKVNVYVKDYTELHK